LSADFEGAVVAFEAVSSVFLENLAGFVAGGASMVDFAFLTFFVDAAGASTSVLKLARVFQTGSDADVLLRFRAFVSGAIAAALL